MDNWKQPSIVIIALRVKLLEINLRGLYIIHFREIKDNKWSNVPCSWI